MLKKNLLFLLMVIGISAASAQQKSTLLYQTVFKKDSVIISFRAVVPLSDGGSVVLGDFETRTNNGDYFLMRMDSVGKVLWSNAYGNDSLQSAVALSRTPDGGFVFVGNVSPPNDFSSSAQQMEVVKIDGNGNLVWSQNFGGLQSNQVYGVSVLGNGKIIVNGASAPPDAAFGRGYSLTLSANGLADNGKFYSRGTFVHFLSSAQQTTDGGVMMAGSVWGTTNSPSVYDPWLIKLNRQGDTVWTKKYVIPNTQFCYLMKVLPDGGALLGGQVQVGDTYGGTFMMKTDSLGRFKWFKGYSAFPNLVDVNFQRIYDIAVTNDGYVATGIYRNGAVDTIKVKSNFSGLDTLIVQSRTQSFIFKTDTSGAVLWSRILADTVAKKGVYGSSTSRLYGISTARDGGFNLVGETFAYGASAGGGLFIHVNKDGFVSKDSVCNIKAALNWSIRNFTAVDSSGLVILEGGDDNGGRTSKRASPIFTVQSICSAAGTYIPTSGNDIRLPDNAVKMYPNPAHDILFVEIPDFTEGVASAQIFDVTGRLIHSERTNFDLFRLNTSRYAKGIYFLKVEIGGKFLTKKFVVD